MAHGRVFGGVELPVLYAHGVHSQPYSVVLAASDYRRAYAGKLARVLERLADGGHLCWLGFSFADQRLAAILREVPLLSGTGHEPGAAPVHVAIMAWDPAAEANDPEILAQRAEIAYGAQVILYPAPGGDHAALASLLGELADARFPAVMDVPARPSPAAAHSEPVGHVFISYVREDSSEVDQLQQVLEAAGIRVWRDTADLWPGEDWRAKIRQAIQEDRKSVV